MFEFLGKMFDAYTLKARLMPGLFLLLPLVLTLMAWFPDQLSAFSILGAVIVLLGGASILSQTVRDQGKELEKTLFTSWGGLPSIVLLRHRDTNLNPHTKSRYHELLKNALPDLRIPNVKEEAKDPNRADSTYDACCHFLREKSRDPEVFSHLLAENISYGARRNLLGMKSAGILLSFIGFIASISAVFWNSYYDLNRGPSIISTIVCIFCCIIWILRINPAWVRIPAFAYAERLLSVCEKLDPKA